LGLGGGVLSACVVLPVSLIGGTSVGEGEVEGTGWSGTSQQIGWLRYSQ